MTFLLPQALPRGARRSMVVPWAVCLGAFVVLPFLKLKKSVVLVLRVAVVVACLQYYGHRVVFGSRPGPEEAGLGHLRLPGEPNEGLIAKRLRKQKEAEAAREEALLDLREAEADREEARRLEREREAAAEARSRAAAAAGCV